MRTDTLVPVYHKIQTDMNCFLVKKDGSGKKSCSDRPCLAKNNLRIQSYFLLSSVVGIVLLGEVACLQTEELS